MLVFPGRTGAQKQARMLVRHGYGVLLYDRRSEGRSEEDPSSFGWDFDEDIRAGIDFLEQRPTWIPGESARWDCGWAARCCSIPRSDRGACGDRVRGGSSRTMGEEVDDVSGFEKVGAALSYGVRDLTNAVLQDEAGRSGRPEAAHTDGIDKQPKEYERRVVGFFDRALPCRPSAGPAQVRRATKPRS